MLPRLPQPDGSLSAQDVVLDKHEFIELLQKIQHFTWSFKIPSEKKLTYKQNTINDKTTL